MILSSGKVYTINKSYRHEARFQTTEISLDITGAGSIDWFSSNYKTNTFGNVYDLQKDPDSPFIEDAYGYIIYPLRTYIGYIDVIGSPRVTIPDGLYEVLA